MCELSRIGTQLFYSLYITNGVPTLILFALFGFLHGWRVLRGRLNFLSISPSLILFLIFLFLPSFLLSLTPFCTQEEAGLPDIYPVLLPIFFGHAMELFSFMLCFGFLQYAIPKMGFLQYVKPRLLSLLKSIRK